MLVAAHSPRPPRHQVKRTRGVPGRRCGYPISPHAPAHVGARCVTAVPMLDALRARCANEDPHQLHERQIRFYRRQRIWHGDVASLLRTAQRARSEMDGGASVGGDSDGDVDMGAARNSPAPSASTSTSAGTSVASRRATSGGRPWSWLPTPVAEKLEHAKQVLMAVAELGCRGPAQECPIHGRWRSLFASRQRAHAYIRYRDTQQAEQSPVPHALAQAMQVR